MAYTIDPTRDWPLLEELRRNLIGHHSPGLQRLLNRLRVDTSGHQTVLLAYETRHSWVLATMTPGRRQPMTLEPQVYTDRLDAEWAVICRRWQAHTGIPINTDRHTPLPLSPDTAPC